MTTVDGKFIPITIQSVHRTPTVADIMNGFKTAKEKYNLSDADEANMINGFGNMLIVPTESFRETSYKDLPEGFAGMDSDKNRVISQPEWLDAVAVISGSLYRGLTAEQFPLFVQQNSLNESLLKDEKYADGANVLELADLHKKYSNATNPGGKRVPGEEIAGYGILGIKEDFGPDGLFAVKPKAEKTEEAK